MNEITVYDNPDYGKMRTVTINGEPWFVAADVCRVLGLEQVTRAMDRLDEDEKGLLKVTHPQSPSKFMDVNGVNEPGLYHLVLCSTKPEAKAFRRWITHDVIPAIRKTGSYGKKINKNLGNVVQLMEMTRDQMKRANADPKDIWKALKKIADDNDVSFPDCYMRDKAATIDELLSMVDYIYAQPRGRGKHIPTYADWLIHAAGGQTLLDSKTEPNEEVTDEIIIRRTRRKPTKENTK